MSSRINSSHLRNLPKPTTTTTNNHNQPPCQNNNHNQNDSYFQSTPSHKSNTTFSIPQLFRFYPSKNRKNCRLRQKIGKFRQIVDKIFRFSRLLFAWNNSPFLSKFLNKKNKKKKEERMASGKRILFMDAVGPLARNLVGKFSEGAGNSMFLVGKNDQHLCSSLSHVKSSVAAPNSFASVYAQAKEHLGGKPNVVIANVGCGGFSLLQPSSSSSLSPPERKRILGEDLTSFRENLEFAHESLSCLLSDVYEPVEESDDHKEPELENPCHVVLLGSMAGYSRMTTGGAVYDSELTYFYENMRQSVKDSNINMVLLDLNSDHISTTGRVVMYDTKYEDGNTEEEVGDAINSFLDINNSDLSKIIWPNHEISGGPLLQKLNFASAFKAGDVKKCDEFYIEKAEPVLMAAAPTEEKAEEEVKPEKTIFNVVLASVNDLTKNKLKVIKAIRAMRPEDSLVQCKEYVTKMPAVLLKDVPKEDAEKYVQSLTDAGGVVELQ